MKRKKIVEELNELIDSRIDMRDTYIKQGNYGVAASVDGYISGLKRALSVIARNETGDTLYAWDRVPEWIQWIWRTENTYLGSDEAPEHIGKDYFIPHTGAKVRIINGGRVCLCYAENRLDSLEQRPLGVEDNP
jgi:hypothetical protein